MAEASGELPQTQGIRLISSGEELTRIGLSFEGEKHFIPALGKVHLFGNRGYKYSNYEMGLTIKDSALIKDKAQELKKQGLFDFGVGILGRRDPNITLSCILILPNGTQLESQIWFGEDKLAQSDEDKYYGYTGEWKKPNEPNSYILFVPENSDFLSQFNFRFSQADSPEIV